MSKNRQSDKENFGSVFAGKTAQRQIKHTTGDSRPVPPDNLGEGKKQTLGVSLTGSEIEYLTAIAQHVDVARHSLLRYAVRTFLLDYSAGKIDLSANVTPPEKKPKNNLKQPY